MAAVTKWAKAGGHQSENEQPQKKGEQDDIQHFLHKMCNVGSFWDLQVIVAQNNSQKKNVHKCAARAKFFAN